MSAKQKCRDLEPMLAAYVDGEVPATERAAVDDHLQRCPPCRTRVAGEQAAQRAVRSCRDRLRAAASESLKARCAAHRQAAPRRVVARHPWVPLSLAATFVLAVAGVFLFGLNSRVEALATQLALDHVKCFRLSPSTPDSDTHAAAAAWKATHGWDIGVPANSDAEQLQLICVRRCFVTDGRAAHMMYKWRGQPLSVFVLPSAIASAAGTQQVIERFGHDAVVWSERGRTYVVLAGGRPDEGVVRYVRANVH